MDRAKAKDNVQGTSSRNSFAVLNSTPTASIKAVLMDLDIECSDVEE
jgi:hypothetical protein